MVDWPLTLHTAGAKPRLDVTRLESHASSRFSCGLLHSRPRCGTKEILELHLGTACVRSHSDLLHANASSASASPRVPGAACGQLKQHSTKLLAASNVHSAGHLC